KRNHKTASCGSTSRDEFFFHGLDIHLNNRQTSYPTLVFGYPTFGAELVCIQPARHRHHFQQAYSMRLGEKDPAIVEGSVGQSSTSLQELVNLPEVSCK